RLGMRHARIFCRSSKLSSTKGLKYQTRKNSAENARAPRFPDSNRTGSHQQRKMQKRVERAPSVRFAIAYSVAFAPAAEEDFERLPPMVASLVLDKVDGLCADPVRLGQAPYFPYAPDGMIYQF